MLSQSFARLQAVDPGFRTDRLLTARLSLPRSRYPRAEHSARFVEALRPRLLALPGVEDAAAVNVVPLNGYRATADVWPADRPVPAPADRPQAQYPDDQSIVHSDLWRAADCGTIVRRP